MSNSAFTPSTTTVTNNVPVNVPVVTAWEAYTPTFEGFGTPTSVSVLWRRVGDNIQVTGNFTSGTPTSATATISLPSGLNLDSTKINGPGQTKILGFVMRANSTSTPFPANTRGPFVITESKNSSTSKVYLSFIANTLAGGAFEVAAGTNILTSGELLTFEFNAPISQWAGSGTTTLATRAVEEYASNSSTSTSGNSTAFAYGPSGSPIRSYTSGANVVHSYTVRFQSQILSTDSLILEVSQDRVVWVKIPHYAQSGGQTINEFGHTTTSYYGMGIRHDIGSTTDISVVFGGSGTNSNLDAWSAFTNYFWRVRKVSSGAQVGYPVSARNIVGDTSGSVVPVGMLGELVTGSITVGGITSAAVENRGSITLSPGIWDIEAVASYIPGAGNTPTSARLSIHTANSGLSPTYFTSLGTLPTFSDFNQQLRRRVNISTTTTYYLNIQCVFSGGTLTFSSNSLITAVRIA